MKLIQRMIGGVVRMLLRILPYRTNRALQRRLWGADRVIFDGMSDADRRRAILDILPETSGTCTSYGPPFKPPWIAFPHIPGWGSMGFRMGPGEDYMSQFQSWYRDAEDSVLGAYKLAWPEPENYNGFYDTLDGWHRGSSDEQ